MKYSIAAAAKATGVPVDTLRAWDRRYGLTPGRDAHGRRVYSESDVQHIQRLREALDRGHPIGRVAMLTNEELVELLSESPQGVYQHRLIRGFVRDVINATMEWQPLACERALAMAASVLSPLQLVESVLGPALQEVGDRWHREELCVAQERMVSSAVQRQLHLLLESYRPDGAGAPVVFATLSGERHELGLLMAATFAASRGVKCLYLGADLPPLELARFCERAEACAVACSFIYKNGVSEELSELRSALPPSVKILVGGAAARELSRSALPPNCACALDLPTFGRELDRLA